MIHSFQRADVVAIEDNRAFEFILVLLDAIGIDHENSHVHRP